MPINHLNQLVLTACIAQAQALRYTPAGLPALNLLLEHQSVVEQAGGQRQVSASIKAVAIGEVAEILVRAAIGSSGVFSGFLATPQNGKTPVFQIQSFKPD